MREKREKKGKKGTGKHREWRREREGEGSGPVHALVAVGDVQEEILLVVFLREGKNREKGGSKFGKTSQKSIFGAPRTDNSHKNP